MDSRRVTCTAPVNIAVIKYWGKRDDTLILPINDSLSATLSQDEMFAKTTLVISKNFKEDQMWLNNKQVTLDTKRIQSCIREIKKLADEQKTIFPEALSWNIHISSMNNFPTAAGLASSAAGYSCLVAALAKLYGIKSNVSHIARQGSGSACRSMFGGFVHWFKGDLTDGSDSLAVQIAPELHWPELRVLIVVANEKEKKIGSTFGMETSVGTSKLLEHRVKECVLLRLNSIKEAILKKDFKTFAEITMQDSNQLHAVCLDTFPPIFYLNEVSRSVIHLVHQYNAFYGSSKVAYTFDAGPNAFLFMQENEMGPLIAILSHVFQMEENTEFCRGIQYPKMALDKALLDFIGLPVQPGAVSYLISTKIGDGPRSLESGHLLDESGVPI